MSTNVSQDVRSYTLELAKEYGLLDTETGALVKGWEAHLDDVVRNARFMVHEKTYTHIANVTLGHPHSKATFVDRVWKWMAPSASEPHSATKDEIKRIFLDVIQPQQGVEERDAPAEEDFEGMPSKKGKGPSGEGVERAMPRDERESERKTGEHLQTKGEAEAKRSSLESQKEERRRALYSLPLSEPVSPEFADDEMVYIWRSNTLLGMLRSGLVSADDPIPPEFEHDPVVVIRYQEFRERNHQKEQWEDRQRGAAAHEPASSKTASATTVIIPPPSHTFSLSQVLSVYNAYYAPKANAVNLDTYSKSADYTRHAATARTYYNARELSESDALRVVYQREPTNLGGGHVYNPVKCKEVFKYEFGVFYDRTAVKSDGHPFDEAPNTVCIYSETFLWNPPGGANRKEIACLSLPAPALDSSAQPNFRYYMNEEHGLRILDVKKYEAEMAFLFRAIETAVRENTPTAFGGKGFKRIVVPRVGQGAFLDGLDSAQKRVAGEIFDRQYDAFVRRMQDVHVPIYQSEYAGSGKTSMTLTGDIIKTSEEGDFIVNAWDPHSAPGNGNDGDRSFDGAIGRSSGVLLTQTAWLNPRLRTPQSLRAI